MKSIKNIGQIIGFAIKYAPVIFVIVKALQMVKDAINAIDAKTTTDVIED